MKNYERNQIYYKTDNFRQNDQIVPSVNNQCSHEQFGEYKSRKTDCYNMNKFILKHD